MSGFLGIPWRVLVTRDYWQRAAVLALYAEGHIRWWEPWSTTWRDLTEVMGMNRLRRVVVTTQSQLSRISVTTQSQLSRVSVLTQSQLR